MLARICWLEYVGSNMLVRICMVYYLFSHSFNLKVILFTIQYFFKVASELHHAITYMNELPMFAYNRWMICMRQDTSFQ